MKAPLRVHVLGASGSGTTTLGRELAARLQVSHIESDDIFWEATDPPFTSRRESANRERLLKEKTAPASWVLSGSAIPWGDFLRTRYTHVIFLSLPPEIRLERIRARERLRFGARLDSGGDMHALHRGFLDWAALYDKGGVEVRSLALHEQWMRTLPCPVLRLSGCDSTEIQLDLAESFFTRKVEFSVEKRNGTEAAPLVNPFYESLNRATRARPEDIFFIALERGKPLGCVRFCVEEGTSMLRGMLIAEHARKQGVGQALLKEFNEFLSAQKVATTFCLPYGHLESFYEGIGFRKCEESEAPLFLQERVSQYRREGAASMIVMRRTPTGPAAS